MENSANIENHQIQVMMSPKILTRKSCHTPCQ